MENNWYVLTGGPGSGKTSLIEQLKQRGHNTVQESARYQIEKQLKKGIPVEQIRKDERAFQLAVFEHKQMLHKALKPGTLTFFDRGYHDSLAYLEYHGLEIEKAILDICKNTSYKKVFVLDMLPYRKDHARNEAHEVATGLHAALASVYKQYGHEVVIVPVLPVSQRADWIETHL